VQVEASLCWSSTSRTYSWFPSLSKNPLGPSERTTLNSDAWHIS